MALLSVVCVEINAQSPQASQSAWRRTEKSDALHRLDYTQFSLEGRYLVPPKKIDPSPPVLVVKCQQGRHRYGMSGYVGGKFLAGYLIVDAVLDFRKDGVPVEFRLDDGKLQSTTWASSTDGSGAFFGDVDIDTLLYGHLLPHKENTNPPVHRIVLGVPEYLGSQIQVQFDMPEPTEIADVCGVAIHKK